MNVKFDVLNDPSHIFVIAEAGSNWKCGTFDDDLKQAKNLIKTAAKAGADAIKFQTYRPETTYVSNPGKSNYLSKSGYEKNIEDIFDEHSMPYEMIPELEKSCNDENILFMSTPFSIQDARSIDPYTTIHKIASFEINHVRLIEFLAKTGKPILVSTGASTYEEIDFCVNLIKKFGNNNIVLLQCTSKYPCPIESLNLSVIPKMKSRYKIPIGFSDHSINPMVAPVLAVGLGATVIEKHFTLDKNSPGPDHSFALNPEELKSMINSIRQAELAYGTGQKQILEDEKELRQFATRSIQATTNISKGDILHEGKNFDILRPGNRIRGLEARFLDTVNGKKATKYIEKGDGITEFE
ncbi:N-acetylneuraminate synthase family protein [Candidatus Nitrosarchaeum limnium]|jgi:N,N'-diacetyllegionaminate synthase|uniref:NeuB family protein n=1 Tax=Candidatus Nitrosarchaeum limnium BG20 TaxID=859192 RepID=S2ES33_9ARCH|nr:N-acetylneuraminate synthase family protein [Candidatus Nitrosarchaeum limnium]EPA05229.1 NeuB family protein [Candidatus Nitrosarchaeum limnium BG20]